MTTNYVRVQEKGQITIPKAIRRKFKLKKGDLVSFVETNEGIMIKPVEVVVSEALAEIGEALQAKGISLEELLERGRTLREELAKKEYNLNNEHSKNDA